ncbi:hypothetical protein CBOM_01946 [Ceraceosorus bombacis]|uniref:Uncharacterized protein n=1 Tax=Ceraceosorus bombacis TaxID=401625 RepID=A0A0P1BEL3_9BASI|nr:hypothetical protein CBOM_01946 [Ceraceosorus bombacis]
MVIAGALAIAERQRERFKLHPGTLTADKFDWLLKTFRLLSTRLLLCVLLCPVMQVADLSVSNASNMREFKC